MSAPSYDVVIPTVGRASLGPVLQAVVHGHGPAPALVVVVDDRPVSDGWMPLDVRGGDSTRVVVRRSFGAGPAAARNIGWTAGEADWVAFLDDDVHPPCDWKARLAEDLVAVDADPTVAGSQARVRVPLPGDRRPTDWERNVAGLARARWITADLAYRRSALEAVGGFDERFRHAYREDSDLALQIVGDVGTIRRGSRVVEHPVPAATAMVSLRRQRGNADDALMRRRYGTAWRTAAEARPTRLALHVATTAFAVSAVGALVARRRAAARGAALLWAASTLQFFVTRARPGPRRVSELAPLAVTSALIPPLAAWHRMRGELQVARDARAGLTPGVRVGPRQRARAVLFDRDGTLVHDVPYNGDPDAVVLVDGARRALDDLRAAGVRVAVVTNQSGIGRGLLTRAQVDRVHQRIEAELGPLDGWLVCPHAPDSGCRCRKPAPGLVLEAAARLRLRPSQCVVVGDTEADLAAARSVGARAILVANAATRAEEVVAAPETAASLPDAVARVLGAA